MIYKHILLLQKSYPLHVGTQHTSNYAFSQILPDELEDLQECKVLGAGTFGECHLKKYSRFDILVVEKQLKESDLASLHKEAYFMQLFSHRCVPHLLGIQTQAKPFSLVMEFLGHGVESMTVHKLLFDSIFSQERATMSVQNWFRVSYDIADAIHYMHEKGYLHRDLKADNVLVCRQSGYLIDFGKVSKVTSPCAKKYKILYPHIAPEVLKGHPASKASDVYSFGKIVGIIADEIKNNQLLFLGNKAADPLAHRRPTLIGLLTDLQPYICRA